ncbi:MAG: efflux RND transporter periplasmic adaptor subunit [Pseudomonadota bacterium]
MKRWQRWAVGGVAVLALAGGITRAILARQAERAQITQTGHASSQGTLRLGAGDLVEVKRLPLWRTIDISGSLRAVDSVVIKARVSGELQSLSVREGDKVTRGQLIARIDTDEYGNRLEQARQQAASAQAQWQIARQTLDNNQALVAQGFISKNALDTAVSNEAAAKATLQAAQAAAKVAAKAVADTQLSSPINGLVSQQFAQAGERLSPDARIVEIVDLSRIELEAALKPEDVAQVRVGTPGWLAVDGLSDKLAMRVARINPSATAGTRAVMVYLSVTPHPALRQGLFAQGQLDLSREDAVVLPRAAVRAGATGPFVQALRGTRIEHLPVTLGTGGRIDGDAAPMIAIASGVQPGERVLRDTIGLLRPGTVVDTAAPAQTPAH